MDEGSRFSFKIWNISVINARKSWDVKARLAGQSPNFSTYVRDIKKKKKF